MRLFNEDSKQMLCLEWTDQANSAIATAATVCNFRGNLKDILLGTMTAAMKLKDAYSLEGKL